MRAVTSSLPAEARKHSLGVLPPLLASAIDLRHQAKIAHWNVRGPRFFQLHELFDRVAEELDEPVDDIAERIGQLGQLVTATTQTLAAETKLPPISNRESAEDYLITTVRSALASFGEALRNGVDSTAQANDPATSDLLTSVLRTVDKLLWFVDSHVQG